MVTSCGPGFFSLHPSLPLFLLSFPPFLFPFLGPLFKVLTWYRVIFPNLHCGFIYLHRYGHIRYDCHPRETHSVNPNAALLLFGGKGKQGEWGPLPPSPLMSACRLHSVVYSELHSAWWDSCGVLLSPQLWLQPSPDLSVTPSRLPGSRPEAW